jgi:glycosyltransferase involved in cell wall biosynthesis
MRLLIVHNEAKYFAGAEKMLGYFLETGSQTGLDCTVALVQGSRTEGVIPKTVPRFDLTDNQEFSLGGLTRQVHRIWEQHRRHPFDLLHGWAARDWELTALAAGLCRRPALGTLHDHPTAGFISRKRQRLMRWSARLGLQRVVCVSEAVRQACRNAGYPATKLAVIHNGLPARTSLRPTAEGRPFRIGFLSAFSERKGLQGLFVTLDLLDTLSSRPWEAFIAGGAQDEAGERLVTTLRERYAAAPWGPRVHWVGWVAQPLDFLSSLDLLMCPSTEFDPFPTVLLEAGLCGLPVLASQVGGVGEIVVDRRTGWLFEAGQWRQAAGILATLLEHREQAAAAGGQARQRTTLQFTAGKMVAEYHNLYSTLGRDD